MSAPRTATSPLRLVGYAALLVAMAFSQSGGRMVADTKFDLVTAPLRFLGRALHLWDPVAAFGQVQNQAYGYAWPMGPFFALGHLLRVPEWAVQRAWWAVLLCLAFFGTLRLAQRLAVGSPLTQVVAAFAFVLTPRMSTLLGGTSVEVWPMALAPWVLLPLVVGAERGSVRRAAALSALVVACCGGVNAVAVAAVLPPGVIWILTRTPGPRRWRLLAWWTGLTVLATAWWSVPLVLLGRYSAPFLDYIENATITTVPTDAARTLVGVSDWVAYFAGYDYPAGRYLVATPFVLLDAAFVVALGLVGLGLRSAPHQRFLVLGVLTGSALVGLGYAGDLHGFLAGDRLAALDGTLAPLRNLHKFDVVLRLPLVLGLAHALQQLPRLLEGRGAVLAARALRVAVALALVALLTPWLRDDVAPSDGVEQVPSYWPAVARFLADDGSSDGSGGVALVAPGANFGVYRWGNVHDDVLQGLATSPWAVRNVIPLAQPGNVVMLDRVTRELESGRPSARLAAYLADNGVSRLVVRNDLDRLQTGAPDPAYVRGVLERSPGLALERSFGPMTGEPAVKRVNRTRLVTGSGLAARLRSVDVWSVTDPAPASLVAGPQELVGDPGSALDAGLAEHEAWPRLLAADVGSAAVGLVSGQVLTDGLERRETNFSAVRWNTSATTPARAPYRLQGPEHTHRVVEDVDRWSTTETWQGVVGVAASSSEAYADALPPLAIGDHPGAALDDDLSTAWRSARQLSPTGQWWQVDLGGERVVPSLTVALARDSAPVASLRVGLGGGSVVVDAPRPGRSRTYALDLPVGRLLRLTAAGRDLQLPGSLAISEVSVPGLRHQRVLALPAPDPRVPVDTVSLTRDTDRAGCVEVSSAYTCSPTLAAPGEDGDTLARELAVSTQDDYDLTGTASLRRGATAGVALGRALRDAGGLEVTSDDSVGGEVATSAVAMADGDPSTTWLSSGDFPRFRVRLPEQQRVRGLRVEVTDAAPASRPAELRVRDLRSGRSVVTRVDDDGRADLPGWRTDLLEVTVRTTVRSFRVEGTRFVEAPAGISELAVEGDAGPVAAPRSVALACGSGPQVRIGGTTRRTALSSRAGSLVRGEPADLQVCGSGTVPLGDARTTVVAAPTDLLRVDSLTLQRSGVGPDAGLRRETLDVRRDAAGTPTRVRLPERSRAAVLTLSQNLNPGWRARLDGRTLPVQRVDGWKQGWLVPAGTSGTVTFDYTPSGAYSTALLVGLALLLLVLGAALPVRWRFARRREHPALGAGRSGALDVVVVVVVAGLLAGWWGLAGAVGLAVAGGVRRMAGAWGPAAGAAMVASGIGLTWSVIVDRSWAVTWTQASSLLALASLVAALVAARAGDGGDPGHRGAGRRRRRSDAG